MTRYRTLFPDRHALFPVIHVESREQALRNASRARDAGCDGVFLINHGMSFRELLTIHHAAFAEFPGWWIGVNCLDLAPKAVFGAIGPEVAGVWVDNAMVDERHTDQPAAEAIQAARQASGWQGLYFGGVAFKYQRTVQDLEAAARVAMQYMDVVTTSGPGTGMAAPRGKIAALKAALGDFPLAIASGITPENVHEYLDVSDCYLVATGISSSFTELDATRVGQLLTVMRSRPRAMPGSAEGSAQPGEGRPLHG